MNSTGAGLNRYTPGNNLINTINSTNNLEMTSGVKSFDQR